jgi:RNA chaperone Hfq
MTSAIFFACGVEEWPRAQYISGHRLHNKRGDPMDKPSQGRAPASNLIQAVDIYINELTKRGTTVQVYLATGVCLTGKIEAWSTYGIIMQTQNRQQLVFKASIASIRPSKSGTYQIFKTGQPQRTQPPKSETS